MELINHEDRNPGDDRLGALLRQSRVAPPLPPRFQEGVWRRIQHAESPVTSAGQTTWLDALASLVLRPRFAMAMAGALVIAGAFLGALEGNRLAQQEGQVQYLASVAPPPLR